MSRSAVVVAVCLLAVLAVVAAPVSAQETDSNDIPVVVVFEDRGAKNPQAIEASGGRVTGGGAIDVAPVLFAELPDAARQGLENRPGVKQVSADVEFTTVAQTTDWGVESIDARSTATSIDESNVTIAVIDTGVAAGHADLGGRVGWGANTVGTGFTTGADSAADGNGHGTHVAGIISAQDNDMGTVGVAPQAQLYAMKALADDGTGTLSESSRRSTSASRVPTPASGRPTMPTR
jgi:subtilisin family serine protease